MALNYEDLQRMTWEDIPTVTTLPDGWWRLRARSASFKEARDADGSASVIVVYTPVSAVDVDESQLDAVDFDPSDKKIFHRFWIEGASDLRAVEAHFELLGVSVPKGGSIVDAFKSVKGQEIEGYLETRTFTRANGQESSDNNIVEFRVIG